MKKKFNLISAVVLMLFAAAACSTTTSTRTASGGAAARVAAFDPSKMTIDTRLAIGTLRLEGTANAITEQQAKDLLPLWKAVRSLGTSSTTAPEELAALYQQIQENLSAAQVQTITKMTVTTDDITKMMNEFGVSGQGNNSSRTNNQNRSGFPGGGPPDAAIFGGPAGGGGQTTSTPSAASRSASSSGTAMTRLFLTPLINLLQQRSGVKAATGTTPAAATSQRPTRIPTSASSVQSSPVSTAEATPTPARTVPVTPKVSTAGTTATATPAAVTATPTP